MKKLNLKDVTQYVEDNIGTFHQKRIQSLDKLKLKEILKRKNPYLFKAKYMLTAEQIIRGFVDAHISSNEETIFGDWLEGLAKYICDVIFSDEVDSKAASTGIDLDFVRDGKRYLITIKSGPKWSNNNQINQMYSNFKEAKRKILTSGNKLEIVFVNGCCYGKDDKPHKFPQKGPDYLKLCGQRFWEFISNNPDLFTEIINPLGYKSKEKNDDFLQSYSQMINKFTKEFTSDFCDENGIINWDKLVRYNSASGKV